ncbi:Gfo/Idh/MocA family protein [Paenibacillus eucommiae]|uniref:Dehydrogenase n=1 Tax=Paenibacillus eucommiae TaxID=1355755 RepID=A0ABS4J0F1_9BACL|nr:Gfo/Idh/MocA family oxidoreductase [Paenibacillus eucommiae]MBP1993327.1 putative dehydrogenase [Paenibacillus eucommiae]
MKCRVKRLNNEQPFTVKGVRCNHLISSDIIGHSPGSGMGGIRLGKLRLGIIGCGSMSETHAKGFIELAGVLQVTAVVDIIPEQARHTAEALGNIIASTDYREILPYVDAVFIVLPHDLHYSVTMECLKAGKHVLVEKPMANSEAECLEMIREARERNLVLMVAYPNRYHPLIVRMKEIIDSKQYGELFQMSIWTEQLTQYEEGHWARSAARLGGGQFFSHGCHYVDLLLWFLGRPVKGTHVGTNTGTPWMEMEGSSFATLTFESGVLGHHAGTWGARGSRLGYSFHAHCEQGMLEVNYTDNKLYFHQGMKEERAGIHLSSPETEVLMELEQSEKITHYEISHFAECVLEGKKPLTDGPESLQGLRVIWRLYEAEEKEVVADLTGLGLDEEWDRPDLAALPAKKG